MHGACAERLAEGRAQALGGAAADRPRPASGRTRASSSTRRAAAADRVENGDGIQRRQRRSVARALFQRPGHAGTLPTLPTLISLPILLTRRSSERDVRPLRPPAPTRPVRVLQEDAEPLLRRLRPLRPARAPAESESGVSLDAYLRSLPPDVREDAERHADFFEAWQPTDVELDPDEWALAERAREIFHEHLGVDMPVRHVAEVLRSSELYDALGKPGRGAVTTAARQAVERAFLAVMRSRRPELVWQHSPRKRPDSRAAAGKVGRAPRPARRSASGPGPRNPSR